MQIKMIGDAVVIEPATAAAALTPADFGDKQQVAVQVEPAFYIALDKAGLLARSVSVTAEDRKVVAALVGNWIAEGFQPLPVDIKAYAKHVRNLALAHKQAKVEAPEASPAAPAAEGGNSEI